MPVLIGATWAHFGNGWLFTAPKGGWEYPAFLTLVAVVAGLLGDGRYSSMRAGRRRLARACNARLTANAWLARDTRVSRGSTRVRRGQFASIAPPRMHTSTNKEPR